MIGLRLKKIKTVKEFKDYYGVEPEEYFKEFLNDVEDMYMEAETLFEFGEMLRQYLNIKQNKEGGKKSIALAFMIDTMLRLIHDFASKVEEGEEDKNVDKTLENKIEEEMKMYV